MRKRIFSPIVTFLPGSSTSTESAATVAVRNVSASRMAVLTSRSICVNRATRDAEVLDEDVGVLVEHGLQSSPRAVLEHALPVAAPSSVHAAQHRRHVRLVEERPESLGDLSGLVAQRLVGHALESAGDSRERAQRGDRRTGDRVQREDLGEIRRRTSRD